MRPLVAFFALVFFEACPAKCDATNCATGCCDTSGKCLSGDSVAACGTAGRTCESCFDGSCSALRVCMPPGGGGGSGGSGGGGATGGGGGGSGGGDGGTRTVTWLRRSTHFLEDGGTAVDDQLPAGQIGLFVRNVSTLRELFGTRTATSYTVPNVPQGAYLIRTGTTFIESTVDTLDTGSNDLGRLDLEQVQEGDSSLRLDVTGLPAWDDRDDLQLFSVGANLYGSAFAGLTAGPSGGMVPSSFELEYGLLAFGTSTPRLEAEKGDRLWVTHQKWQALITTAVPGAAADGGVLDVPLGCNVLDSSAQVSVTIDAGANVASVSFTSAPKSAVMVNWPRTLWDARRSEVHPMAVTSGEALFFSAEPLPETASGDLISCFNDPRFDNPVSDVNRSVMAGNPYPAGWSTVGVVENTYRVTKNVADAGSWSATGSITLKTDPGQPLAPGVHSPSMVRIQSMAADQIVATASALPLTVSWVAPIGPPNADDYVVQLLRISRDGSGVQTRQLVVQAVTRDTSFTFPGGQVATGAIYQLRVRARETGAPADRPFSTRFRSTSEAISNPFLAQ